MVIWEYSPIRVYWGYAVYIQAVLFARLLITLVSYKNTLLNMTRLRAAAQAINLLCSAVRRTRLLLHEGAYYATPELAWCRDTGVPSLCVS